MKIIREPSVYLVGKQIVDEIDLNKFLTDHNVIWQSDSNCSAEVLAETGGRLCYMSFAKPRPGGNAVYLQHIKESGHGSVLEHGVWNFIFTGISRSLTHELVRHRAGMGYSQLSQRYVDESVAEYIEPDIIANDPQCHQIWVEAIEKMHDAYQQLSDLLLEKELNRVLQGINHERRTSIRQGKMFSYPANGRGELSQDTSFIHNDWKTPTRKTARQAARSILPNATETKIFVTANARAIRHFLEQRGSRHAEPEIRKLANKVLDIMQKDSPNLFCDYTREDLGDGTFEINTPYRKV